MQDGAVINRDWLAGRVFPPRPGGSPFEEREPIRVEQFAPVGGELEPVVLDAPVHCPEGRQKAAPRIVAALQNLLAEVGRRNPQLLTEGGNGVVLVEKLIAEQEQVSLLGQKRNTSRIITVRAASYSLSSGTPLSSARRYPGSPGRSCEPAPRPPDAPDSQAGR